MNKNKTVRKQPLPSENDRYRPETCQRFHFLGNEIGFHLTVLGTFVEYVEMDMGNVYLLALSPPGLVA